MQGPGARSFLLAGSAATPHHAQPASGTPTRPPRAGAVPQGLCSPGLRRWRRPDPEILRAHGARTVRRRASVSGLRGGAPRPACCPLPPASPPAVHDGRTAKTACRSAEAAVRWRASHGRVGSSTHWQFVDFSKWHGHARGTQDVLRTRSGTIQKCGRLRAGL